MTLVGLLIVVLIIVLLLRVISCRYSPVEAACLPLPLCWVAPRPGLPAWVVRRLVSVILPRAPRVYPD